MVSGAFRAIATRLRAVQWSLFFHLFYIEPVVFVLLFSHSLSGTIIKNEVVYQACATVFHYNESDCRQLGTKNATGYLNDIETEVQPYAANLFMMRTVLESIVPAFCGIFIGSWSDHYGRKPLLLVSMIGFSFTYIIAAVVCELSRYYSVNPWWYILSAVPHSILGGNCVFSVAAFCFISDVTDTKMRPYRMISLEVFFTVGLMMGSLLSSYVYAATNATITFTISGLLMCMATVFIALCVPESLTLKKEEAQVDKEAQMNVECNDLAMQCTGVVTLANVTEKVVEKPADGESGKKQGENQIPPLEKDKGEKASDGEIPQKDTGLFSYVHVKDMWVTCFKSRPYNDRSIILLVTGSMFLVIFVVDGILTVFYLFVREKFHWSIREFTFYETVNHVTGMFGVIMGFLLLRKVFHLSVVTLALMAFLSDGVSNIIKGLAEEPWHLYMAIGFGALRTIGGPMCRTIVSNIVPPTDLGKIFSIKNILQSIAPFVAAPLYTVIYKATLTTYPGFFNMVSALLHFIGFIFLAFVLSFKISHKEHYANILK